MQDRDAVSERVPSLGDALTPLGVPVRPVPPLASVARATSTPLGTRVPHGVTGVRTEKSEPARLEEGP